MKILLLGPSAPWPPASGFELRSWQTWTLLRRSATTRLFALGGSPVPPAGVPAEDWIVAPVPDASAEGTAWLARPDGLPSDAYADPAAVALLAATLDRFAPDAVVFDSPWLHGFEDTVRSRRCRTVLSAHNVESALARETAERERHPATRLVRRRFAERVRAMENALAGRMDEIWVCSAEDGRRFVGEGVIAPVRVVANAIDTARYRVRSAPPPLPGGRPGPVLLYPGAFHHAPNARAAEFLLGDLWPRVSRRHPDARLVLCGVDPTEAMSRAAADDGRIVVTGRVADVVPHLRHATVMPVPLFEGGGTRFKILEAFAAGLPVISTPKGAEGLGAEPGTHYLEAVDGDSFAAAIDGVLADATAARAMAERASEYVERFSFDAVGTAVADSIGRLASLPA